MRSDLLATVGRGLGLDLGKSEGEARLGADAGGAADVRLSVGNSILGSPGSHNAGNWGRDPRQPTGHKRDEGLKAKSNERLRRAFQQTGDGDGDVVVGVGVGMGVDERAMGDGLARDGAKCSLQAPSQPEQEQEKGASAVGGAPALPRPPTLPIPPSPLHSARPCSAVVSAARAGYPAGPYAWRPALSRASFILIANCRPNGISTHIRGISSRGLIRSQDRVSLPELTA